MMQEKNEKRFGWGNCTLKDIAKCSGPSVPTYEDEYKVSFECIKPSELYYLEDEKFAEDHEELLMSTGFTATKKPTGKPKQIMTDDEANKFRQNFRFFSEEGDHVCDDDNGFKNLPPSPIDMQEMVKDDKIIGHVINFK